MSLILVGSNVVWLAGLIVCKGCESYLASFNLGARLCGLRPSGSGNEVEDKVRFGKGFNHGHRISRLSPVGARLVSAGLPRFRERIVSPLIVVAGLEHRYEFFEHEG